MPMPETLCFLTVIRNNFLDFRLSNISSSWEILDNPGSVGQKSGLWAMSPVLLIWILVILLLLLCNKVQNMHKKFFIQVSKNKILFQLDMDRELQRNCFFHWNDLLQELAACFKCD